MTNKTISYKQFLHFFFACFVVYAMSSCTVKSTVFSWVEMDYSSPMNKSKTTGSSTCHYIVETTHQAENNHEFQRRVVTPTPSNWMFSVVQISSFGKNRVGILGNFPPRYILFQRLKIAAVTV